MGQKETLRRRSACNDGATVIDLNSFRKKRQLLRSCHTIFYVNEDGECRDCLCTSQYLQIKDIRSTQVLETTLMLYNPALIMLESKLTWADPFEIAHGLTQKSAVPIVLICGPRCKDRKNLKRAYASGIHDILYTPIDRDELYETLGVLLKLQKQIS